MFEAYQAAWHAHPVVTACQTLAPPVAILTILYSMGFTKDVLEEYVQSIFAWLFAHHAAPKVAEVDSGSIEASVEALVANLKAVGMTTEQITAIKLVEIPAAAAQAAINKAIAETAK